MMRALRRGARRLRHLWDQVTEPRHLKATYFVLYGVALLTGIATLTRPPQSIEGAIGSQTTAIWASFVIMGAFGGLLTVFPGWWFAERLSIVMLWLGAGIYLGVVIYLHASQNGSRLTQMGFIILGAGLFFVRWLLIRKYTFEPRS
jgi:hypothetical protein